MRYSRVPFQFSHLFTSSLSPHWWLFPGISYLPEVGTVFEEEGALCQEWAWAGSQSLLCRFSFTRIDFPGSQFKCSVLWSVSDWVKCASLALWAHLLFFSRKELFHFYKEESTQIWNSCWLSRLLPEPELAFSAPVHLLYFSCTGFTFSSPKVPFPISFLLFVFTCSFSGSFTFTDHLLCCTLLCVVFSCSC